MFLIRVILYQDNLNLNTYNSYKILLFTLALICLMGCGSGGNKDRENSCIYNGMYWGDEKEDIIAKKGEPISKEIDEYDFKLINWVKGNTSIELYLMEELGYVVEYSLK